MVSKFEDHFLVQRLRWARDHGGKLDAAFFVQTEQDVVRLIEECERLADENERLSGIVTFIDLKAERDSLAEKVEELKKRLEEAGL